MNTGCEDFPNQIAGIDSALISKVLELLLKVRSDAEVGMPAAPPSLGEP